MCDQRCMRSACTFFIQARQDLFYTKHIMPNGVSATAHLKNVSVLNAVQTVSLFQADLLCVTFLQANDDTSRCLVILENVCTYLIAYALSPNDM